MIAGAIAAVWLDTRNTARQLRTDIAKRIGDTEASQQTTRAALKDVQESLRETQAKVALLESRLAESQTQQAALEALYRDLAPSRDEWALTEIEQVLVLASQQLQLAGNVQSALAALQLADSKLQRLDRPQFAPLRRALARDMDRLKAVPFVDVQGLGLRLDQAIASVDALPLALEERLPASPTPPPPQNEASWRRFLRSVWQDLRQLVRKLMEQGDRNFIIDLANVSYMDNSGLGQLCLIYTMLHDRRGEMKLRRPTARIRKLLQITKLDTVLEILEDANHVAGTATLFRSAVSA